MIGCVAGAVSVAGYVYIQPMLAKQFGLDDTCGVHNLHGLPGVIGAIGGAVSAASASTTMYGESISTVFLAEVLRITSRQVSRPVCKWPPRHHFTVLIVLVVRSLG